MLWGDRDLGFLDLLCRRPNQKLCCTFHQCPDTLVDWLQFVWRIRGLAGIILMSESQRTFFEGHGVDPRRIHVVRHGIDVEYFRPGLSMPTEPFTVISVGSYRRNFALLREVCEALSEVPSVQFKVIAPAAYRKSFAGLRNVTYLCGIGDEELLNHYQSASCLLMTAEDATANNGLLEGLACGLPIIAERVGGIPEYLNPEAGILTEPRQVGPILRAITRLRESSSARAEMRHGARQNALQLAWPLVAQRTMDVYSEIWHTESRGSF
jgi:glycosyltransferase involved in cell wall biosynthesis